MSVTLCPEPVSDVPVWDVPVLVPVVPVVLVVLTGCGASIFDKRKNAPPRITKISTTKGKKRNGELAGAVAFTGGLPAGFVAAGTDPSPGVDGASGADAAFGIGARGGMASIPVIGDGATGKGLAGGFTIFEGGATCALGMGGGAIGGWPGDRAVNGGAAGAGIAVIFGVIGATGTAGVAGTVGAAGGTDFGGGVGGAIGAGIF